MSAKQKHLRSAPPIVRFRRIAQMLLDGRHITGFEIARRLEVSTKTAYRDLDFMRDQMELPIETNGSKNGGGGYYFTEPVELCRCCTRRIK